MSDSIQSGVFERMGLKPKSKLWEGLFFFEITTAVALFLFFIFSRIGPFNNLIPDLTVFLISVIISFITLFWMFMWIWAWVLILPQVHLHLYNFLSWELADYWPASPVVSLCLGLCVGLVLRKFKDDGIKHFSIKNERKVLLCYSAWLIVGLLVVGYFNLFSFNGWTGDFSELNHELWDYSVGKPYHVLQPFYTTSLLISAPLLSVLIPKNCRTAIRTSLVCMLIIFFCYYIFQFLLNSGYRWPNSELHGLAEDPHHFASITVATFLATIASIRFSKLRRALFLVLLSVGLFLILFQSGSVHSLFFLSLVLTILFFYHSFKKLTNVSKRKKRAYFFLGFFLISLLSFLACKEIKKKMDKMPVITDFSQLDIALSSRPRLLLGGLRVVATYPLMGYGTDNYLMTQVQQRFGGYLVIDGGKFWHVHSYFIQKLAENGVFGFVLFFLGFIFPVVQAIKNKSNLPEACFMTGILVTNILAHSLLISSVYLMYCILLGTLNCHDRIR